MLTNIGLIDGLQAMLGAGVTSFNGGNILLGGAGSDLIEGHGGDDIIDGDAWLNVRVSVRENADGSGAEIRSVDHISDLAGDMLAGRYNPGQLVIVREILNSNDISSVDAAVYSDIRANYSLEGGVGVDADGDGFITVTHNALGVVGTPGIDGVDKIRNIERLQFSDGAYDLVPGLNSSAVGLLTLSGGATATVGVPLSVSIAGVTDADNLTPDNPSGAITGPVQFFWQKETEPGSGVFSDIELVNGLGILVATGPTFTPTVAENGLALRARAVFFDDKGAFESAVSATSAPVNIPVSLTSVAPTINDITPTENQLLTALVSPIIDLNGTLGTTFTFQWQQGSGLVFTDIPGATQSTLTPAVTPITFNPTQSQVLLQVRLPLL